MKILSDECVTRHLKTYLVKHEVITVREMQWSGIKNGKLMALCVDHGFDILLTIDKNLVHQQNLQNYSVAIVVLNSLSSKVEELITFLPAFTDRLSIFERHKAYQVDK